MPRYEYRCEANGEVVEVSHSMSEQLSTWGEVCERAGIDAGKTPTRTPVEKVISLGFVKGGSKPGPSGADFGGCGPGCGCAMNN